MNWWPYESPKNRANHCGKSHTSTLSIAAGFFLQISFFLCFLCLSRCPSYKPLGVLESCQLFNDCFHVLLMNWLQLMAVYGLLMKQIKVLLMLILLSLSGGRRKKNTRKEGKGVSGKHSKSCIRPDIFPATVSTINWLLSRLEAGNLSLIYWQPQLSFVFCCMTAFRLKVHKQMHFDTAE